MAAIRFRAVVLVLGDIGRSPRMQYHALSLADKGAQVEVVGYAGSQPRPELLSQRIRIHHLKQFTLPTPRVLYIFMAPLKVIYQILQLFFVLMMLPAFDCIIVQNPPGLPALLVAKIVCLFRFSRLIIDWHNFGYTLLALRFKGSLTHPFVRAAKFYERWIGLTSDANICVTKAMKSFLRNKWGISATVLYDRPPAHFKPLKSREKHELFKSLETPGKQLDHIKKWNLRICSDKESKELENVKEETSFTVMDSNGVVAARSERPAIVVSSTSWTPDEDFGILIKTIRDLDRLIDVERLTKSDRSLPPVLFAITGKGPLKAQFEHNVASLKLQYVRVVTLWLKAEDYPRLLGSSDIGLSLHTSSSGLDLPMKVVDMFGCGLPVCAHRFACVDELVEDGKNGYTFDDAKTLASSLCKLLRRFPENKNSEILKKNIVQGKVGWSENWNEVVYPLLISSNGCPHRARVWQSCLLLTALASIVLILLGLWTSF
mmetsp:Transcript_21948/g.32703  ORF Transcript_21948/g.32703 Transcript_21948/m.32703 type:complete len:488 (-) Transcript_21948:195-1658(-)